MEYGTTEEQLLKYERMDYDKFCEKQETGGSASAASKTPPVSTSWLSLHVQLPSRLAALTIICILAYEILVGLSMTIRKLRWVMVNWMMYVLLGVNGMLLLSLGLIVLRSKKGITVDPLTRLGVESRIESKADVLES